MKKIILLCILSAITLFSATAQLKVTSTGNVGINNSTPQYRLDVEGTARYSNWTDSYIDWTGLCSSPVLFPENDWYLQLGKSNKRIGNMFIYGIHTNNVWYDSDDKIKVNKSEITEPLTKILSLKGKQYNFASDYLNSIPDSFQNKYEFTRKQYGFIAQELLEVIPELVSFDSISQISSVNYVGIIPILTEAIKEQQKLIINLQNNITTLNNTIQSCCNNNGLVKNQYSNKIELIEKQKEIDYNIENKNATLFQNNPNPFGEKTEIKYYLPSVYGNSKLVIYNLNGSQILSYTLNGQGLQTITIDDSALTAGAYYYTLLVDNIEIDTKKMILLK